MRQPGDQEAQRDIFNIDNKGTVTVVNHSTPHRSRSEALLLQAVKQEVISRLAQSLHNAVFLNLGMQSQPQQVKRPWDAEIKIGSKSPEALPAETVILEVFDRAGIDGRLLILGEPGAGKTTTMLDLAKELCDRAEQKPTAFIPVLLNLSSWKDPKQTMTAWLVEELKSKYGVRKDIGTQWLAEKQLLPLLDGLDEVKPEHQEGCVQAINCWLESEDRPPSLAVCCRREEYEKVVRGQWQAEAEEPQDETRMHLNGAILLQTLTKEQIQAYLTAANQPELWQMLRHDKALRELIRTPLWLSITLLSYEGLSLNQWQRTTSTEQRLALLLDAYVERMLHKELNNRRYAKRKPPTAKQTRQWLVYLAQQLQRESQTEFLIEKMQPYWLQSSRQNWAYRLLVGSLFGVLVGSLFGVLVGLLFGVLVGLLFGLLVGSLFGVLVGSLFGLNDIDPVEVIQISLLHSARHEIYKQLGYGLLVGVLVGLIFGLFAGVLVGLIFGLLSGVLVGLTFGLLSGLVVGLVVGLLGGLKTDIETRITPNQGITQSARNTLILTIIALVIGVVAQVILSQFLEHFLKASEVTRVASASLFCLVWFTFQEGGGNACIQHFALRLVLYRSGSIPWNYARFLDYCTERLFLQRVGGRYRFIHKSLQEHFARMGK